MSNFKLQYMCLIMFLILTVSHLQKNTIHSHQNHHQHQDSFCKIVEHKMSVIQLSLQQSRLLQNSSVHSFKITPQFYSSIDSNKLQVINRLFVIAARYFQEVIKVTTLSQSLSVFHLDPRSCSIKGDGFVPLSFRTSGFNVSITDQVVFVQTIDSSEGFLAAASVCILRKWPTYGVIVFNLQIIDINIGKRGQFHNNIYVTMHEMTHIMGFSSNMYRLYYTAYESNDRIPENLVVSRVNGRNMIITPTVKAYIQSFFGCSNTSIGAFLENQGGSGSAGSHWERSIYLDQMMTASAFRPGLKVSQLTLSLLKDSGFYQSVDVTKSQRSEFGRGKGCSFATETSSGIQPQYCTSSDNTCDYYSASIGFCGSDQFSSKKYIQSFSQTICNFPATSTSTNTFDVTSKCVNSNFGSGLGPHCIIAECITSTTVRYTVRNTSGTCTQSINSAISLNGVDIQCPADYRRFCARKPCDNFCGSAGLCLNGVCLMANISQITISPQSNQQQSSSTSFNIGTLIGIIVPVGVGILFVIFLILCCCKCCQSQPKKVIAPNTGQSTEQMMVAKNNMNMNERPNQQLRYNNQQVPPINQHYLRNNSQNQYNYNNYYPSNQQVINI